MRTAKSHQRGDHTQLTSMHTESGRLERSRSQCIIDSLVALLTKVIVDINLPFTSELYSLSTFLPGVVEGGHILSPPKLLPARWK